MTLITRLSVWAFMLCAVTIQAQTTYYSKATATDFNDVNSWGTNTDGSGTSPGALSSPDVYIIQNAAALSLSANATIGKLTITSGSLTVSANQLDVAITSQNNSTLLVNGGTLNVSGTGAIVLNGNFSMTSGAFNQTGGTITIDGNNNNTTATSVATGTALVSFASNNVTMIAGVMIIVDPHAGAATETALRYTPTTSPYPNVTSGHTVQFGDGISTTTGGSISGFRITQGTRLTLGNVIVNTLSGRYVYSSGNLPIVGDLTILSGEFQIQTGQTNAIAGNIVNNGTLSTIGTLYFGTYTLPSTLAPSVNAQTVSGTGIFRNSTTTSTANFAAITVNNTNAAGVTFLNANSLLNGTNTGTVSGTLTFTAGSISTGVNEFVLGISTTSVGILAHTAGGFASGSKMTRWIGTATSGTPISASSLPSFAGTGSFPFVNSANRLRVLALQQTATATTGGKLSVVYNDVAGTSPASIVDGAYTVETRSNDNWTITQSGITGTPTYSLAVCAQNLYSAANGNSRITLATAAAAGNHQTGTNYPAAQRLLIPLTSLANIYYIGASNTDIPFQSIATGNWEDGTTWNKGVAPSCTDAVIIGSGHNVTVNATAGSCQRITINTGGTLTVAGSSLTNGCTLNNNTLTNNGTLTVTGGTLNINGNLICAAGSTFNQSGGDINIDGNGGATGTNVASGTSLCQLSSPNINWTGGNLTIIDPHANATASESFTYTNSTTHVNVTSGHTLRLGDGISTDAGGNATNGFRINTWPGSNRISFNNVEINTGTGTNRHVTTTYSFGVNGNFTITSGEFRDNATTVYFAKNLTNNGTYVNTGTGVVYLGTFLGGTVGVSSSTQTVSGVGTFSNNVTIASKTADVLNLTINNNNATGITLDRSLSVSGTLTMTSGVTTINPSYALTLGTATVAGTLTGTPSVTNMLKGIFARTFASSRTATGTYSNVTLFPLGSGATYLPIWIDPTIASTGASIVSVSAFDTNSGTTGAGVSGLSPFRWEYSNTAANLTSAFFRISQTGLNNGKAFVQSTSAAGAYDPIVGVTSTVAATNLTSSSIPVGTMTGFLSYGDLTPCIAPADQATNWVSTAIGTTTLSASYTAATSAPTGYIVVRYPTGSTPTNPVDLTTYATGNTLGTGTVVYFGAATSFSATGLVANTTYDFYVYDYNNSGCAGPIYNSVTPLLSTVTTCASAVTAPTSSAGTAITTTGFTANWTASTTVGVTDYYIEVSSSSTFATLLAGYPLSVSTATSYSVTGLSSNTTYYYRVRANVGACSSANSTSQTVVTDCAAISVLPHTQNFATFLPSCWKNIGEGGTPATGPTVTTTGTWAADGFLNVGTTGAVKVNLYSNLKKSWLISPAFDLSTSSYILKYKVGLTVWNATTTATLGSDDEVQVLVSNDGGITWNSVKTYNASTSISNLGVTETIDLSAYTSNQVKIAFWANEGSVDDTPDNDFFIDDFSIEIPPACVNPSNLTTTNFNATSVDFSWTAPTSGTSPAGFNWEVRTSGAGGSGATGLVDAGTTTNTFASSTLLSATTAYSIYVQTDCGAGSTSTWTGPLVITTPCASISAFPWNEGFEGIATVGATAFPPCWKKENGDWQSATATTNTYNDPRTGTKYITETYSATNEWIWSPTFQLTAGVDYTFKFWYAGDGLAGWTGEVGVNSSQNSTGATIIGAPFINPTTTAVATYQEVVRTFTPSTTGDYSFGIRINATSVPWYLGFDDFSLDLSPTCQNPTDIALTTITGTSADFSWTAPASGNTPSAYNWEVRTSGAGGSGTTGLTASGNVTTTAATANGLTANTNYSIYVQSDCSAGNTSTWFGPFAITTPCASVTLPVVQDFEGSTTLTNCWKSVFISGTKAFSIGTTTTAAGTSPNPAAQQGTNRLLFPSYSTSGNQTRLVSPPMDASNIASIDTKFQWYESTTGGATSYLTEGVQVQYSYDGINWTNSGSLYRRYGATTGWFAKKETITGNVPVIYVGFLFTSNAGYDSYIDAINIESTPTCVNPTAITTTTITATSVDFTWTAPSLGAAPSAYNWEIRTSGAAGSGATGLVEAGSVATNAATSTLLAPTTTYSIYVQSDCSTSGISTWFGPFTFTTACASVSTFPYLEPFTTFLPGCWSNFGQGGTPATGPTVTTTGSWTADGFINSGTTGATKVNLYSNTKNSWLISPTFNLSNVNATYQLKYKVALTTWNGTAATTLGSDDEVQVLISTNAGASWTSLKTYNASTVITNTSTTETIDLIGYNATDVKIAFWASEGTIDDAADNDFFLDDIAIVNPITTLSSRVYLNSVDANLGTPLMDDYIKTLANFPLSDPYSSAPLNANFTHINSGATATTTPAVLAITGNNAIVDWVFLELRTGPSGTTTVQYTKAALLQKDGDIVDVDGVSPVAFPNAPAGNYFVTVRHRNHLGCRTDNLIALSNATPALNFTNGTVPLYGSTPVTIVSPSLSFMNGGDSNSDGSIDAFDTILWEIQNGLFDDYTNNADYNMDGSVDAFDTIIWELNNGKFQELD